CKVCCNIGRAQQPLSANDTMQEKSGLINSEGCRNRETCSIFWSYAIGHSSSVIAVPAQKRRPRSDFSNGPPLPDRDGQECTDTGRADLACRSALRYCSRQRIAKCASRSMPRRYRHFYLVLQRRCSKYDIACSFGNEPL